MQKHEMNKRDVEGENKMKKLIAVLLTCIMLCTLAVPALGESGCAYPYTSSFLTVLKFTNAEFYDSADVFCAAMIIDMIYGLEESVGRDATNLAMSACDDGDVYIAYNTADDVISVYFYYDGRLLASWYGGDQVTVAIQTYSGSARSFVSNSKADGFIDKYTAVNGSNVIAILYDLVNSD